MKSRANLSQLDSILDGAGAGKKKPAGLSRFAVKPRAKPAARQPPPAADNPGAPAPQSAQPAPVPAPSQPTATELSHAPLQQQQLQQQPLQPAAAMMAPAGRQQIVSNFAVAAVPKPTVAAAAVAAVPAAAVRPAVVTVERSAAVPSPASPRDPRKGPDAQQQAQQAAPSAAPIAAEPEEQAAGGDSSAAPVTAAAAKTAESPPAGNKRGRPAKAAKPKAPAAKRARGAKQQQSQWQQLEGNASEGAVAVGAGEEGNVASPGPSSPAAATKAKKPLTLPTRRSSRTVTRPSLQEMTVGMEEEEEEGEEEDADGMGVDLAAASEGKGKGGKRKLGGQNAAAGEEGGEVEGVEGGKKPRKSRKKAVAVEGAAKEGGEEGQETAGERKQQTTLGDRELDHENWSLKDIIKWGSSRERKEKMKAKIERQKAAAAALAAEIEAGAAAEAAGLPPPPPRTLTSPVSPASPPGMALQNGVGGGIGGAPARAGTLAPQVQVIDGRVVVNRQSLTVQAQERQQFTRVVTEDNMRLNSLTYMNRLPNERWSTEDTELFYKALSQFGTDFTLISHLFPGRQRRHLKNKYTRESKTNAARVDEALRQSANAPIENYKDMIAMLKESGANVANGGDEEEEEEDGGNAVAAAGEAAADAGGGSGLKHLPYVGVGQILERLPGSEQQQQQQEQQEPQKEEDEEDAGEGAAEGSGAVVASVAVPVSGASGRRRAAQFKQLQRQRQQATEVPMKLDEWLN